MNPPEAFAWLDAHVNLESLGVPVGTLRRVARPTLARIEALIALLGSPQLEYPSLHLTGTNGKTSVARIATVLLVEAGLSVGTYTSPHLERVNERIGWNGTPIDDPTLAELLSLVATIEPHLPEPPSFFEILTGVGLRWFADVAVEVAVVEVGMGGAWDATNVVHGDVAVITNVSVDHVEYLGPTRADIAADKAGIVDAGATLVLGETDPELRPTFEARRPGRLLLRDRDFGVEAHRPALGGRLVSIATPGHVYRDLFLPLHGAHQADNAAVALTAVEGFLGRPLGREVVEAAFATVRSPGRLEVVGHGPLVVLDGAHNVAGARALGRALAEEFPSARRTLVVGMLREKEPHEMLDALDVTDAELVVCARAPSARALDPDAIADAAHDLGVERDRIVVEEHVDRAVERARDLTAPEGQILVTGSLYVVGAARASLVHDRRA